jgi:site-specific DNA-methyltransferase (adenine-specific)
MIQLHHGDCLDVLRTMPDASVDAIVTDPPYGLRFMGKKWDYDVPTTEVWAECLRVLKPGGHLLAFAGTRTQHRMAVRIEDAGFEIRDLIMYCYGSGFPKSTDISRRIDLEEQKRWLDVSKALDNLETAAIMEAWKDHSKAASTAGLSFAKSPTATGISTPKSGFAPEPVLLQADQESSDALALVAELSFKEAHLTSKAEINSAPMPAAANESQDPVKCAEHSLKRSNAISTNAGIAQCAVKEWPSASMGGNLKAVEALRIWLGSKPSSMQAVTNALCAVLTADLKHITLSQSKTFQSFDTTRQTACASAISVTITESMAESLISFTVDTLRKQAIDRAAGAEREVVGVNENSRPAKRKGGAGFDAAVGGEALGNMSITAPATPEARQWAGWGTALKPSIETITWATKPLPPEKEQANILVNLWKLEARLWLLSSASVAAQSSMSSQSEYGAACAIAQWTAEDATSTRAALRGLMDTWQCEMATHMSLSIVTSWRRTLEESSKLGSTSTTETESSTTIDWRTLSCCLSRITPESIIQACSLPGGFIANASTAAQIFNASLASLQSTLTLFAIEPATWRALDDFRGEAVKPNLDPLVMARKPLSGTVAANVLEHGTGAINVDGCRVESEKATGWGGGGSALHEGGLSRDGGEARPVEGRWPANLIHDGSEEVVGLFPQGRSSGIYSPTDHSQGKRAKCVTNFGGMGVPSVMYSDSGSAARFFYTAKADATDRNDGLSPGERNAHPTVKPVDLMCYLCRLVTPPGGIVLDPFMGSGSTGKACVTEGFSFIGIERDADSFATAQARVVSPMPLFKDVL